MRALRLRESLYIPLLAFLIVLVCFLLYPRSLEGGVRVTKVVLFKHVSTNQELDNMLRNSALPDRTVLLTMVDESMASPESILDIFLESFKSGEGTKRLLNHLVIIAMDPKAFDYCKSLHHFCIHPSTFSHHLTTKRESFTTTTGHHNSFTWTRNDILLDVLRLGYNIIFTDADVLWLRSPFINFNPINELTISCNNISDGQRGDYLHDGGIFFLKANSISFEFFKHWKLTKVLFPSDPAEESLCTTIKEWPDVVESYGFRVHHVDTSSFGGFCQLNNDMLRTAYTIQANCCDDLKSKVHDLRIVLDDWIQFRKSGSGDNALDQIALRWPHKCPRINNT